MVKQFTVATLRTLVKKCPGDKKEVKKFVDWCSSYDPAKELLSDTDTAVNEFIDQWIRISLQQIEYRKRKEADKSKTTESED